jgi:hypothetical protein
MTQKEKAKELVDKYYYLFSIELENTIDYREAKQCALIAVDEILEYVPKFEYGQGEKTTTMEYDYLQEVKQEIEKL